MKRLISCVVIALLGFYVIWPLWTGYRIKSAFETDNSSLLESKVDFPSVRSSLKPVAVAEMQRQIELVAKEAGPLGALLTSQLKGEFVTRLAEASIESIVTPAGVMRAVKEGRDLRQTVERALSEQMGRQGGGAERAAGAPQLPGGLGGLAERFKQRRPGGDQPQGAPTAPEQAPVEAQGKRPAMGLSNIKSFRMDDPLGFSIGVARNPASSEPDITAKMRFSGWDWKIVGVVPRPLGR